VGALKMSTGKRFFLAVCLNISTVINTGLPLLWNQREKWLLFQVLTKKKWETTGRSGESTGRSQNISLIVPLFTFAGHYRYIQTHCQKNKKIKRADQILPEVYGTTLI
jgi:hypothetical protein